MSSTHEARRKGVREWIRVAADGDAAAASSSSPSSSSSALRVLQFNALADMYATTEEKGFPFADPKILKWEYRRPRIVKEVVSASPDVVFMEEIDHFGQLAEELTAAGYSGVFHAAALTPSSTLFNADDADDAATTQVGELAAAAVAEAASAKKVVQGVALFFRCARLRPTRIDRVSYTGAVASGQVGIIAVFDDMCDAMGGDGVPRRILAAATHLKSKPTPGFAFKRAVQGTQLIRRIEAIVADAGAGEKMQRPYAIVVGGDFNDVPTSPVCRVFRDGGAMFSEAEVADSECMAEMCRADLGIGGDDDDGSGGVVAAVSAMSHHLALSNAYDNYAGKCDERAGTPGDAAETVSPSWYYTTLKKRKDVVCRVIDYIYYSTASFSVRALLDIPALPLPPASGTADKSEGGGDASIISLPYALYPSDHVAIGVELEFK